MRSYASLRLARPVVIAAMMCGISLPLFSEAASVRTNWVERWVTNTIEVRVPVNRIVNEYHTNLVQRVSTNVVEFYTTNMMTRTRTNYVPVTVLRTNYVQACQTNYRTINLTNWSTVVVFKTNWVTRPMTNLVEVELQKTDPETRRSEHGATVAVPSSAVGETLVFEAKRGARIVTNNSVEVMLRARWMETSARQPQVQQWRIEREDKSILCFGQDQEFRRALPVGRYKIEVKVKRTNTSPLVTARATLLVTAQEVSVQQKTLAQR